MQYDWPFVSKACGTHASVCSRMPLRHPPGTHASARLHGYSDKLHARAQLLWIFLPFASTAILFVFVAIFCKWKKGIYAFLLASLAMFVSTPPDAPTTASTEGKSAFSTARCLHAPPKSWSLQIANLLFLSVLCVILTHSLWCVRVRRADLLRGFTSHNIHSRRRGPSQPAPSCHLHRAIGYQRYLYILRRKCADTVE